MAPDGTPTLVSFGDHAAESEVARHLVRDDDAAGRGTDDELRPEAPSALGEATADDLGLWRPLEQVELLQVGVGMAPRSQLEVPAQERARLLESLDDDRVYWDADPPFDADACSGCELMRPAASRGQ